ncbi:MAG: NADH-quinone oxidoreductase subunit L [Propionibacteriaceae bacterium]|jgi:NADH-quinone oxidoreductase subunit L|nr:NADH-quinone oxidoreductase subunit L [Propionibacteriaceae bacterium]
MFLLETGLSGMTWVVIALPIFAAALLLLLGEVADGWGHWVGVLGIALPFGYAVALFLTMLREPAAVTVDLYTWLRIGAVDVGVTLLIDQLSILFTLLVTGVGALVAIYSIGYLAHDPGRRRFFGFINLFIAAMLLLVLADNYVLLFLGWEGVGLASYLLIGFWQQREAAALAAKKAFLMNRFADLGFITAIAVLFAKAGSVRFSEVAAPLNEAGGPWAGIVAVALLLAACGKSAQVPLQSWLLDAMEGPTPVSALIHAATMVSAGVYLMLRSLPLYELVPAVQVAVAVIGVLTLFVGAWIGAAGRDMKRVLAGSTMSQVGYLMLAAGLGPVGAVFAVFHLLTHGVFKADLFLSVGAVTESVGFGELRRLGGLVKVIPWVFAAFTCGYLAIIGVPFLAGFYSKEHIISAAWDASPVLGGCAIIGAGLTAGYMTRLLLLTFVGAARWTELADADAAVAAAEVDSDAPSTPEVHHAPASMGFPLVVLSLLSLGGGLALNGWLQGWLGPVFGVELAPTGLLHFDWLSYTTLGVVLLGVVVAVLRYRKVTPEWFDSWQLVSPPLPAVVDTVASESEVEDSEEVAVHSVDLAAIGAAGLYADALIDRAAVAPVAALTESVAWAERRVIRDGTDASWRAMGWVSALSRRLQNGSIRTYALLLTAGTAVALLSMLIWVWM